MAGRPLDGRAFLRTIGETVPNYSVDDLLSAFHFGPEDETLFREAAKKIRLA